MTETVTAEPGQSAASARALAAYMERSREASAARCEVVRLQGELRKARAAVRAAEKIEREALERYEATPYVAPSGDDPCPLDPKGWHVWSASDPFCRRCSADMSGAIEWAEELRQREQAAAILASARR